MDTEPISLPSTGEKDSNVPEVPLYHLAPVEMPSFFSFNPGSEVRYFIGGEGKETAVGRRQSGHGKRI